MGRKGRSSLVTGQIGAKGLKTETVLRVGKPYEEIVDAAKRVGCGSDRNRFARLQRRWTLAAAARQQCRTSRQIRALCGIGCEINICG